MAKIWELATGRSIREIPIRDHEAVNPAFSTDGSRLLLTDRRGGVVLDLRSGREICTLIGSGGSAFSPDGRRVVSAYGDAVSIWDAEDGRELLGLKGHNNVVRGNLFSPDGREIYTIDESKTLRIWLSAPPEEVRLAEQ